jgi:hypothetical protein
LLTSSLRGLLEPKIKLGGGSMRLVDIG